MISLHPITPGDANLLQGTSYAAMPAEAMDKMLSESLAQCHDGKYFELFAVMDNDICVGLVSLYETAPREISCGPEIKPQFRRRGYGYWAVITALERATLLGYTQAVAQVRQDNTASIALHQKLGFSLYRSYTNKKGHSVMEFKKLL